MPYNREEWHRRDQEHLADPQPGDYWHDMYAPVARVLGRTDKGDVILQDITGMGGKEIDDAKPAPKTMQLAAFIKWLSYSTMPDKTWAHVIPRHIPPLIPQ